jgi:hypothetical protein
MSPEAMPPEGQAMQSPVDGMSPEEQPPAELQDGMNPSVDAETIRMLRELKDSSVMDMGILASVGAATELGDVIMNYRDDIQSGVSATGRILLNLMTKKETLEENIGAAKYKQLVSTMKPLFIKMSDMYADIYYLSLESEV